MQGENRDDVAADKPCSSSESGGRTGTKKQINTRTLFSVAIIRGKGFCLYLKSVFGVYFAMIFGST